jgi:hypothetical protein
MIDTCGIVALAASGAFILLTVALAVSLRRGLAATDPLSGSVELVSSPGLGLALHLRPGRKLYITGIDVPRSVVHDLGLQPPIGFAILSYAPPEPSTFEPDLEPLLNEVPDASQAQIAAETQRQLEENIAAAQQLNIALVRYSGHVTARPGAETVIHMPALRTGPAGGHISVHYRYRTGFLSALQVLSLPFPNAPSVKETP